jgi:DNA polymerase-3 subunit delta'
MNELLPWLASTFADLQQRRAQGRLAHALLLTGPAGVGKYQLAELFAQSLLCAQPQADGQPCGQCHSCSLYTAETHPDLYRLRPEEDSRVIRIDQIRALIQGMSLSSHYGRHKVVILNPADAMNMAAANALLKTLEEPPADTVLLLITDRPSFLPATIRSRCQTLRLALPARDEAQAWLAAQLANPQEAAVLLALAAGAPLAARDLADEQLARRQELLSGWQQLASGKADPVKLAAEWVKPTLQLPITWIYGWVADMIRLRSGSDGGLTNEDAVVTLQNLAQELDLTRLYGLLDRVLEAIKLANSQVNPQTLMEGILLYWSNLPRNTMLGQAKQQ